MAGAADLGGTSEGAAGGVPGAPGRPPARRRLRTRAGWAVTLLVALLLAFGMRAFVFQAFSIPSASMESTLNIGDRILVWKAFFNWHDVRQGDIVVFTHPPADHCAGPPDTDLVKRVIALGGQTIYSAGNNIYVDGRRVPQSYLPPHDRLGPPIPAATRQAPFHVPRGDLYVMGDNRQISCDSRFWALSEEPASSERPWCSSGTMTTLIFTSSDGSEIRNGEGQQDGCISHNVTGR